MAACDSQLVSGVAVQLLGGFAVRVDEQRIPDSAWRLRKARELVKMLALAPGHELHREQVMDALWRERAPEAAANNLYQAVHVVRRVLGAANLTTRDGCLRLLADVDVDRFRTSAAQARRSGTVAAYRAAVAGYGGVLLPENRYDDWTEEARDELAALCGTLLEQLAQLGRGRFRVPSPDGSSFVGRRHELTDVVGLMRRARVLTLTGPGGAGKTRLALEAARQVEAELEDGAVLVELAPVPTSRLVADAVAAALEVQPPPGRSVTDAVVDFLAPRTLALLLDNCEHVLAPAGALVRLLTQRAPDVRVLTTSREPLGVPGEVLFRVPSLALPPSEVTPEPERVARFDAVRLLVERTAAAAPGFAVTAANAADLARICCRLDGLPLALELVAARVATLGPAAVAERLDDRFRLLRAANSGAPTRQQTLAATLQWSHDLLDAEERVVFRRLSVFAGGFDLDAVERVCADATVPVGDVAEVLARLADKSLVAVEHQDDTIVHHLLETVRAYALARLEQAGEGPALRARHAQWALAIAEQADGSARLDRYAANLAAGFETLLHTSVDDALRCCVALLPFWLRRIDLVAGQRSCSAALDRSGRPSTRLARALLAAAAVDLRRGAIDEATQHAQRASEVAEVIKDADLQWRALQLLGDIAVVRDDGTLAAAGFERGLQIARRQGWPVAEALGVYALGAACAVDDAQRAHELMVEAAERLQARDAASSSRRVPSPINVGEMRDDLRTGTGLRLVLEDTLQPFAVVSGRSALGYVLLNHASVARMRGQLETAAELLDRAEAQFKLEPDRQGLVSALVRRAYLLLATGAVDTARDRLQQALDARRRENDRRGIGLALTGLGLLETTVGNFPAAGRHLDEACDLFRRASDRWGLVSSLWRAGELAAARGRYLDADAITAEALEVVARTGRVRWVAHTLAVEADIAARRGDRTTAVTLLNEARVTFGQVADRAATAAVTEQLVRLGHAGTTDPTAAQDGW